MVQQLWLWSQVEHDWTADEAASLCFCHLILVTSPCDISLCYLISPQTSLPSPSAVSVCLCPQVISGANLPSSRTHKTLDPFVRVEIYGIPSDSCRKSTHTNKNNGECHCSQQEKEGMIKQPSALLKKTASFLVHFQSCGKTNITFTFTCLAINKSCSN